MSRNGKQAGTSPAAVECAPVGIDHVRATFKSDGRGGATLQLRYLGQLSGYDAVWLRLGERRHGEEWLDVRDVRMDSLDGQVVAKVRLSPGEPVEGVNFAFFAFKRGTPEPAWDSAGHPFGCYVLDAKAATIEAR